MDNVGSKMMDNVGSKMGVWGVGSSVQDLGFGDKGLGVRVEGFEFRFWGLEIKV